MQNPSREFETCCSLQLDQKIIICSPSVYPRNNDAVSQYIRMRSAGNAISSIFAPVPLAINHGYTVDVVNKRADQNSHKHTKFDMAPEGCHDNSHESWYGYKIRHLCLELSAQVGLKGSLRTNELYVSTIPKNNDQQGESEP
jgi:hypothetical protein